MSAPTGPGHRELTDDSESTGRMACALKGVRNTFAHPFTTVFTSERAAQFASAAIKSEAINKRLGTSA